MPSREVMRRVLEEHVAAENAHDRSRVLATYCTRDPVFEDVPAGVRYTGGEEIIGNYGHLWDGFPGLVRRIDRWTFGDYSCVIELTLTGAHDGQFRGVAATGRTIALRIIAHFAFDEEGLITQETAYYDTAYYDTLVVHESAGSHPGAGPSDAWEWTTFQTPSSRRQTSERRNLRTSAEGR
ncbi:MAG: nuclear transport factor 2 family protein [Dehalococcoidia bacterium]